VGFPGQWEDAECYRNRGFQGIVPLPVLWFCIDHWKSLAHRPPLGEKGVLMVTRSWRTVFALFVSFALSLGALLGVASAQVASPVVATPVSGEATPEASPVAEAPAGQIDLDVLFIGAHPDDEAFALATYGQWAEYNDIKVGVITITRGEGGGNAAGTEEGPALGILREAEEREAVGGAGIEHIYNLDQVDFYYTVSAPLTSDVWGYEETLERVVRIIRQTHPDVITTMNPSPTPGNHGNHQMAGRFAVAAFAAAGDPEQFPDQITEEGLEPWTVSKVFQGGAAGQGAPGPDCATNFEPVDPTDQIYGVWSGTPSEANGGATWAAIARDSQRKYVSQGWSVFPDVSEDPNELGCGYFTLIDSRVPFTPGHSEPTAMLDGALVTEDGALPLGTTFYLTTDNYQVLAGESFTVTAHFGGAELSDPVAEVTGPEGWTVEAAGDAVQEGDHWDQAFTVTIPADAASAGRYQLSGTLTDGEASGNTLEVVEVISPVTAAIDPLPNVAVFEDWVQEVGQPQLDKLITPSFSMGVGQTYELTVNLTNNSGEEASGSVDVELPVGFEASSTSEAFDALAAGSTGAVTFQITNTDPSLPTSNQGEYQVGITTTAAGATTTEQVNLNLVPVTTVLEAATPVALDGTISDGEYPGEAIDLSRVWEGTDPDSPADGSGSHQIAWGPDGIYFGVTVTDDVLGTVLPEADAKRHWRTDSVEIAIDPLGTSENTSSTFKVGIFPTTQEGNPAAYRDADNHQGPVAETAPGFELASSVSEPYTGYIIEAFVPYSALPADIDPDNATINIFIYDSDTQDLTGQTRLGWSTYGGVQGDPYRWGKAIFEGYTPPADARTTTDEPVIPLEAAQSVNSPQSILQSTQDGVSLAGKPKVSAENEITVAKAPVLEDGKLKISLASGAADGTVSIFAWDGSQVIASTSAWALGESNQLYLLDVGDVTSGTLLIGYETDETGEVQALAVPFGE